jgi:riboflavin kinase/FMN adenylyltransferase
MTFTGMHITGRGRGRALGFPTINLHDINTVIIQDGVYAARATINGTVFMAAMFVGESPTFKEKEKSVELFLIGLGEGDEKKYNLKPLISTKISVETVEYIRPVIKFDSKKELIEHIAQDVKQITEILTAKPAKI